MNDTNRVIIFVLAMTTVVALVLALMQNGLKATHDRNEALYSKKATLAAVANQLSMDFEELTDADVQKIFEEQIEQYVVNASGEVVPQEKLIEMGVKEGKAENLDLAREQKKPESERLMPLYVFEKEDGTQFFIVYARGKGLWDEIWGNIALEADMNSIAGVSFDHKAETPGLGAEIKDNAEFKKQFIGKKFYDESGEFKSVSVRKGGAKDPNYEVDGISGATITGDGVTEMLERGIKAYESYFNTLKS